MVLKTVCLLLVLAVSQVFATSVLHLRSLEIFDSRQATCDICTTVSNTVTACGSDVACVCTPAVAGDVQKCINCGIAANPSPEVITAAQTIITSYEGVCGGVPGVPAVTLPPTTGGGSSTVPVSGVPGSSTPLTSTSSTRPPPVTVTSATTPATPIQNTVVPSSTTPLTTSSTTSTTSQGTGSSDVPGGVVKSNSASQYKNHMSLVAIGVMVGAALIL